MCQEWRWLTAHVVPSKVTSAPADQHIWLRGLATVVSFHTARLISFCSNSSVRPGCRPKGCVGKQREDGVGKGREMGLRQEDEGGISGLLVLRNIAFPDV